MRIDREIEEGVLAALEWEPSVDASDIGVSVTDGVVTLRGTVPTFNQKYAAERAAQQVVGVRAIASELQVAPDVMIERADSAIAAAAANALEWDSSVPTNHVQAVVRDGWITLTGTVQWHYQRTAAQRAVGRLLGVKGVSNLIGIEPGVTARDVKAKIESAFKRSAEIDAQKIIVDTHDGAVILRGSVHSLSEREQAERAAWSAPGVTKVEDYLVVTP